MANPEHLEILKKGVEIWNKWREENPDIEPDLSGAELEGADLKMVNFIWANLSGIKLTKADLFRAILVGADLGKANLSGADLNQAELAAANLRMASLRETDLNGAILPGADLTGAELHNADLGAANFSGAILYNANLTGAQLHNANLGGANLERANLQEADLCQADLRFSNLSEANITGADLYLSARDDWKIDGIKCDYVFFEKEEKERTPKDRDFRPGEFEDIYKQLPTFEYYFEHGFTPIDAVVMDQIVTAINERHPEFELRLDSFHSRGQPHAKFTVLHKEHVEPVQKKVEELYERNIKNLESERDHLRNLLRKAVQNPKILTLIGDLIVINAGGDAVVVKDKGKAAINKKEIEHMSGDTFKVGNVSGNINFKSRMENVQQNIVNAIRESDASDDLKAKLEELAKAVETMTGEMPEDQAKNVKADLELLVKGVAEKKPKWYSVSGEGLIEAAKAVGSLGKPVVELAQSVLKLLP